MLDQGAAGGGDLSGGQLDGGTMTPQEGDVDVQIEQVLVIWLILFLQLSIISLSVSGSGFSQASGFGSRIRNPDPPDLKHCNTQHEVVRDRLFYYWKSV
jgi:hypothetical protein